MVNKAKIADRRLVIAWSVGALGLAWLAMGCSGDDIALDAAPRPAEAGGKDAAIDSAADQAPASDLSIDAPPRPDLLGGRLGFIGGRTQNPCKAQSTACDSTLAQCQLKPDEYLQGTFPELKQVIVSTPRGGAVVRVLFFLENKQRTSDDFEVAWINQASCSPFVFRLQPGQDLFGETGEDDVLVVEHAPRSAGAQMVRVTSKARTGYLMRIEID